MESINFTNEAVAGLITQGALMMLIPAVLLLIWWKRTRENLMPALIGAAVWFLFAILLKIAPAYFLMQANNPVAKTVSSNVWLTYLTAGILAGVFEETGRFIAFRFMLKGHKRPRSAVSYGIGHGGFESVYVGFQTASLAVLGLLLNTGAAEKITAGASEEQLSMLFSQLGAYTDISFGTCMLGVFERLPAIVIHISLSVFVFAAVRNRRYTYLFPAAMLLHAFFDFSIAFYGAGLMPAWAMELMLAVIAAVIALFAAKIYKKISADYAAQIMENDDAAGECEQSDNKECP